MLRDQKTPVMVENTLSSIKTTLTNKTITFFKQDGTADAGEVAGTVVFGVLEQAPILDLLGDRLGEYSGSPISSSLVFTNGAMENGKEKGYDYHGSNTERFKRTIAILENASVANGSYAVDYFTGIFIIKKATTETTQTITSYIVKTAPATGSVNVTADTEFPVASAITDNYANPTTTDVKAFGMAWDGANWDRMLGNSTDGLLVNLGVNNDVVSKTATASQILLAQNIIVAGTTFTTALDLSTLGAKKIEATLDVTAISGVGTSLQVIPQYSYNNITWFDQPVAGQFTTATTIGNETLELGVTALYLRYKLVVVGASADVTFDLYSVAKA